MTNISNTDQLRDRMVLEVLLGGADGAVERQEAAGQHELLHSDRLPSKGSENEEFAKLGFTFGDPDPADPIFRPATLPDGWKREGSDHSMWSYIVDADGYRRVAIFYKAAFYDRSAHMSIERVPMTRAQSEARASVREALGAGSYEYDEPFWDADGPVRKGADVVYEWHGCKGSVRALADGDTHPRGAWAPDGRTARVSVAPDGTIVDVDIRPAPVSSGNGEGA